jgi:hypothetical protein
MKSFNVLPSKAELDRLLKYDPETGKFFWRVRSAEMFAPGKGEKRSRSAEHACNQWNSRWAGKPAMCLKGDGYHYIHLNYRTVLAHRAAWKIMTGQDPIEIDHVDGNRSNNKWSNLKNGTRADNLRNVRRRPSNTSGYTGVRFAKKEQKWIADIRVGTFDSREEAAAARKKAEALLGYSPNHGRETSHDRDVPLGKYAAFNSTSGVPGVTWDAERDCWQAWISAGGKQHFLGRFLMKDAAVAARKQAEQEFGTQ